LREVSRKVLLFLVAQVLGHLFIERDLEHRFSHLFEQSVRTGQRWPLLLGQPHQLDRSLLRSGGPRLFLRHIQWRHHGTFLAELRSACQAGNTDKSTVPKLWTQLTPGVSIDHGSEWILRTILSLLAASGPRERSGDGLRGYDERPLIPAIASSSNDRATEQP